MQVPELPDLVGYYWNDLTEAPEEGIPNTTEIPITLDYNGGGAEYTAYAKWFSWETNSIEDAEYIKNHITYTVSNPSNGLTVIFGTSSFGTGNVPRVTSTFSLPENKTFYGDIEFFYKGQSIGNIRNLELYR